MKKTLLLLVILIIHQAFTQDFHHTQIYNGQLLQSPSYVGALAFHRFLRKNRVMFSHRQQWRSINSEFVQKKTPFISNYIGYDGVFRIPALIYLDFFSVGADVFRETAGDLNLSTTLGSVNFSYHKALDRMGSRFLSMGTKFGLGQKSLDFNNAYFDNQWTGRNFDPTLPTGENFSNDRYFYPDISLGLLYTKVSNFISYRFGTSFSHLNRPSQRGFLQNSSTERLFIRFDLMGGLRIPMNEWTLRPDLLVSSLGPAKEFSNTVIIELPSNNPEIINSFGFGARIVGSYRVPALNDALSFHYQLFYKDFDFAISYDLNLSSLRNATGTYGAFETSLIYYFGRSEPTKVLPQRFKKGKTDCPKHLKSKQGWVN
ncbi:MAG: PorP/SprF family type IX secretion system membrane protein [Cytophagales bacterium]